MYFAIYFRPLSLQVTTKDSQYSVLESWREGKQLIHFICRSLGFKVSNDKGRRQYQKVSTPVILVDLKTANRLSFPPHKRVETKDLIRWTQKGSIVPFIENITAKVGQADKDNSDGYLAREIRCTGLALTAFLDEFHPELIVFSSAVQRLVRRLVVI